MCSSWYLLQQNIHISLKSSCFGAISSSNKLHIVVLLVCLAALPTIALLTALHTCAPPSTCPKLRLLPTTLSWCFTIHISYVARVFKVKKNDPDLSLVIGCLVLLLWLPLHLIAEYPAKIYFSKFYSATHIKELYLGVFKVADH